MDQTSKRIFHTKSKYLVHVCIVTRQQHQLNTLRPDHGMLHRFCEWGKEASLHAQSQSQSSFSRNASSHIW